ncbi:MAG: hypothetical protein LBD52_06320 [Prevotellaceae bacterium]|nr:hypothetical protein [Prevotellaceae bacterium]
MSLLTDYYLRKELGWRLSRSLEMAGSMQALQMALSTGSCTGGLVHHSDSSIQYCSSLRRRPLLGERVRRPPAGGGFVGVAFREGCRPGRNGIPTPQTASCRDATL